MTLKNWFFKFMGEDCKRRLWAIALVCLLFFFSFPVAAVLMSGSRYLTDNPGRILEFSKVMFKLVSKENLWIAFIIPVLAIVCGASGFSWLDSRKKVDFYHSLPVKREKIFAVNYINGILIVAAPYWIGLMAGAFIAVSQGVSTAIFWEAMKGWSYFMVYYLMLYATVILAVIMTGNMIVGLLGVSVFFFYGPVVLTLIEGYFDTWFYTYCDSSRFMDYVDKVSPFINYCQGGEMTWKFLLVRLAVGLVLTGIALILYKKRPSEAAGKAMAFSFSKPVIRILIVMASALSGAIFFWGLRSHIGWAVFGLITGTLISHCVVEIIYNFDFKKLFSHYKQMLVCMTAAVLILFAFRYDWFGYDRYIPKEEKVASAAVLVSGLDDWVDYGYIKTLEEGESMDRDGKLRALLGENQDVGRKYVWVSEDSRTHIFQEMKLAEKEPVIRMASEGIESVKKRKETEMSVRALWEEKAGWREEGQSYVNFTVQYTLNNGKTVRRQYTVKKELVNDDIRQIFDSTEYKEGVYPVLAVNAEAVAESEFEKWGTAVKIDGKKARQLLEAYQEELRSMKQEDIYGKSPVGVIRFLTEDRKALMEWEEEYRKKSGGYAYHSYREQEKYPVYETFDSVLELLTEENEYLSHQLSSEKIGKLVVDDSRCIYKDDRRISGESLEITDKEEIRELIPFLVPGSYNNYNAFTMDGKGFLKGTVWFLNEKYREEFLKGSRREDEIYVEDVYGKEYYDTEQYDIDVDRIPQKYLDRISYDETTKKLEEAGKFTG